MALAEDESKVVFGADWNLLARALGERHPELALG